MFVRRFRSLHASFAANGFGDMFAPRKPRHPLLRILVGLVGVGLLAVLLIVGLVVGAAMVGGGLLRRLYVRRRAQPLGPGRVLGGDHRVLRKPALSAAR